MKLCVFQGTFNPIHRAHLKMARYAAENFGFDKILFIPAYKPPHKDYDNNMCTHRLNMVKLAVSEYPEFDVSDIEYKRGGKSYTYLTILDLYKLYNIEGKINFIIGTDAFQYIESWYESDKLKELVDFIVFKRDDNFDESSFDYLRDKGYKFSFTDMKFFDISSTELRERILNNQDFSDMVTKNVEEYIKENGLYKN
ncbi:nicotinate (nicotinamide) nucleotide adenylyltransferase [bacterium]|nr:nicotinate (nicotinamide) nucleotide adenylyltransferase [bacterium]